MKEPKLTKTKFILLLIGAITTGLIGVSGYILMAVFGTYNSFIPENYRDIVPLICFLFGTATLIIAVVFLVLLLPYEAKHKIKKFKTTRPKEINVFFSMIKVKLQKAGFKALDENCYESTIKLGIFTKTKIYVVFHYENSDKQLQDYADYTKIGDSINSIACINLVFKDYVDKSDLDRLVEASAEMATMRAFVSIQNDRYDTHMFVDEQFSKLYYIQFSKHLSLESKVLKAFFSIIK